MCGNCHEKASGSFEPLNYILGVTWQCLLYMLRDVSNSMPCLLARFNGAHHCAREISRWIPLNLHMELICEYMSHMSQCFTQPLYLFWLNVNFQSRSYCHFQVFVSIKRVGFSPRP